MSRRFVALHAVGSYHLLNVLLAKNAEISSANDQVFTSYIASAQQKRSRKGDDDFVRLGHRRSNPESVDSYAPTPPSHARYAQPITTNCGNNATSLYLFVVCILHTGPSPRAPQLDTVCGQASLQGFTLLQGAFIVLSATPC